MEVVRVEMVRVEGIPDSHLYYLGSVDKRGAEHAGNELRAVCVSVCARVQDENNGVKVQTGSLHRVLRCLLVRFNTVRSCKDLITRILAANNSWTAQRNWQQTATTTN